ncbi:OLC1v1032858C1 [Oldenlandia corymbosa var. corymbosa]|uniref:OLC1v1032858C1 n=1 Tax=Oldenlandia corymbosa var. corymbosa TaxID=529605 RepID=A0AAV1CNU6_OLDCO|nr:OLC1v1032858C1 [Oldenlandia corymbosa var. corymbosa]
MASADPILYSANCRRKEFEDLLRQDPLNKSVRIEYAKWEEEESPQHLRIERARYIWLCAVAADRRDHTMWSNVYSYGRSDAWKCRCGSGDFRGLGDTETRPATGTWLNFAKFEAKYRDIARARTCFDKAVDQLMAVKDNVHEEGAEAAEQLFLAYAEFEEKCNEVENARRIYIKSLEHFLLQGVKSEKLCSKFVAFENLYGGGDREGVDEDDILWKKRFEYEDEVRKNPLSYDAWIKYATLERFSGGMERARSIFERAVDQLKLDTPEL